MVLRGQMEKIEQITSDEPFLLVSTIRSSSPFPLQIVSLKYKQVQYDFCAVCLAWQVDVCEINMYMYDCLRLACCKNACSLIKCFHLIVRLCPQQPEDVEDVGGIPSILSGRKFTR